ncbi:related to 6-hydroxy-d-nicotine oxidase [Lecanosticta acicola]|uniref:Related to 6-hydroxy-d-nicotine oxidase n=1 Tax=Lecanosticta acicola TaxID=111012 RepID=A0AAI9E989_9PEZI|nr:related to 6-hydroxy-d-nicotine oxidase [Lecanosticta acicola]
MLLPALLLLFAAALSMRTSQHCCNELGQCLPAQVLIPNMKNYTAYNKRWSDTASAQPACIFLPRSTDHVATAVRVFTAGGLQNHTCHFAIVSGGTSTGPGANDIDGGITLDLSLMDRAALNHNQTVAYIQPAASWPNVYNAFKGTGHTVAGGDNTAVAGMVLAGGISLFQGRMGFSADNVVNYQMVDATGEILNVDRSSHPDLFLALKGGGNNFGIVTRVDMKPIRQSSLIWGGETTVPMNATSAVLSSLDFFVRNSGMDPASGARVTFSWNGTAGGITNFMWNTINDRSQTSLMPFFGIGPQISSKMQNNISLSDLIPHNQMRNDPHVHRSMFATVTVISSNCTLFDVNRWTNAIIHNYQYLKGVEWRWSYDPLPNFYRNGGVNVMGLNYTKADLMIVSFNPSWSDPAYDKDITLAAKAWVNAIQQETNVRNTSYPFEYLGYAAPFQDPFASYGASNLQFLQDTAKKYDPTGVFQTLVPGGFKLSRAGQKASRPTLNLPPA